MASWKITLDDFPTKKLHFYLGFLDIFQTPQSHGSSGLSSASAGPAPFPIAALSHMR